MKRVWVTLMLAATTYAATAQAQDGGSRFGGRVLDEARAAAAERRAERADRAERREPQPERQAGSESRAERQVDDPARDRPRREERADRPRPVWGGDGGMLRPEWRGGARDPERAERREERREDRADRREDRREDRAEWRNDRRGDRAEWRRDRRDDRADRWRDRREEWRDGRRFGNWGFGWNGGFDRGRRDWDGRDWNRGWRNDSRYDWLTWRGSNRSLFHLPRYYPPRGFGYDYRRFGVGTTLSFGLFDQSYWIDDPWSYRLPPAYGPYRWVRYFDDVLLVDLRGGRVVDAIHGFFW